MKNMLMLYRSVIILSIFIHGFTFPVLVYGKSGCEQANWGSPLEIPLKVTSPFNPNPPKDHYGVDYRAADGDNVLAVADGKILRVDFGPFKELGKPDARTGLKKRSWGQYVVVKHVDGSTTLYAHLVTKSIDHLSIGMPITKGAKIGEADSTGGVTGPHLHLEYSPTGEWNKRLKKRDPHPCLVGCPTGVPLTISGTETITRNSSAQYTATGCPSSAIWSVSGTGATISSTGLLTAGATSCGSLTITATCPACNTSATHSVRVADAGQWYLIEQCGRSDSYLPSHICTLISGRLRAVVVRQGFLRSIPPSAWCTNPQPCDAGTVFNPPCPTYGCPPIDLCDCWVSSALYEWRCQ